MDIKVPKRMNFGSGELYEVSYLEQILGIKRRTAMKCLSALHIKPMYIGRDIFFSLSTFKRIMFILTLPGSPGFLFPGSSGKNNPRLLKDPSYISEVTQEILDRAEEPRVLAEMEAANGTNPQILKQLLMRSTDRPRKKTKRK